MHPTGETEWIFGRHKKRVNQIPVASKDVKSTQEMAVRNPNPYASQPLCHRLNNQKSCSTQVTTAPPSSEKAELGCPNKPVSPTSASVATESRPTMEDKILRTTNTICLNFSPFPPLPQAML